MSPRRRIAVVGAFLLLWLPSMTRAFLVTKARAAVAATIEKESTTTTTTTTTTNTNTEALPDNLTRLLQQAQDSNCPETAFALLVQAQAVAVCPHAVRAVQRGFVAFFQHQLATTHTNNQNNNNNNNNNALDHLGLASLLVDMGEYTAAGREFEAALRASTTNIVRDRAAAGLCKARATACDWRAADMVALQASVRQSTTNNKVPAVHPYEALLWPCLTIRDARHVAARYAARALASTSAHSEALSSPDAKPPVVFSGGATATYLASLQQRNNIRVGYISPDFTGVHPLGALVQDVFHHHNNNNFDVYIYSLSSYDGSPAAAAVRAAATHFCDLSRVPPDAAAATIRRDGLDVLVDYTAYVGPSAGMEIMAQRPAPVQISHMGFPACSGAAAIFDYTVGDATVVPPRLRPYYTEQILFMPHCFFVNSHERYLQANNNDDSERRQQERVAHGLPARGMVYCCHNRSEKLDPVTFRCWLQALVDTTTNNTSVLWLLSAGPEMEANLRAVAQAEFPDLSIDRLVFCGKVDREAYLRRLALADLFLDTPAYNAHTTGCDCLVAGVPMVSLLRDHGADGDDDDNNNNINSNNEFVSVATDKLPSRVGASFLKTLDLPELIATDMDEYRAIMTRCSTDPEWFAQVRSKLDRNRFSSPLFDTGRWMKNWENGLRQVVQHNRQGGAPVDIHVVEE